MCAKSAKQRANKSLPPLAPEVTPPNPAAASSSGAPAVDAPVAWIDAANPRRRLIGKIVLAGVWLYVAALWLLALDQTFHWGLFGP